MKHRSNLCTRIFTALALSVTMLVTAVPVSAGEIPENNDLSMLTDNNIPVVYITVDNSAEGFSTFEEVNESVFSKLKQNWTNESVSEGRKPKISLFAFSLNFPRTKAIADDTAAARVIVDKETKTEFKKFT